MNSPMLICWPSSARHQDDLATCCVERQGVRAQLLPLRRDFGGCLLVADAVQAVAGDRTPTCFNRVRSQDSEMASDHGQNPSQRKKDHQRGRTG